MLCIWLLMLLNSTGDTFSDEAHSIVQRTTKLLPELLEDGMEILAAFAGLRPSRVGGARVERTDVQLDSDGSRSGIVVHNYGAGGTGFQAGLGMAQDAIDSVTDVLSSMLKLKSRL
jgi:D-amino-acid oxidase